MSGRVYATVAARDGKPVRIGAEVGQAEDGRAAVLAWYSNGPTLGWYYLDRFEGGRLTARTLEAFFRPVGSTIRGVLVS